MWIFQVEGNLKDYNSNMKNLPEEKEPEKPKNNNIFENILDYFEEFTALKVTAFILTFIIIVFFNLV